MMPQEKQEKPKWYMSTGREMQCKGGCRRETIGRARFPGDIVLVICQGCYEKRYGKVEQPK